MEKLRLRFTFLPLHPMMLMTAIKQETSQIKGSTKLMADFPQRVSSNQHRSGTHVLNPSQSLASALTSTPNDIIHSTLEATVLTPTRSQRLLRSPLISLTSLCPGALTCKAPWCQNVCSCRIKDPQGENPLLTEMKMGWVIRKTNYMPQNPAHLENAWTVSQI